MIVFTLEAVDLNMLRVVDHNNLRNEESDHILVKDFWSISVLSGSQHRFDELPKELLRLLWDFLHKVIFSGNQDSFWEIPDQGLDKKLAVVIESAFEQLAGDVVGESSDYGFHLLSEMFEDGQGNR